MNVASGFTRALALMMVLLVVAQPLAAADTSTGLDVDSDKTPNPTLEVTVEKASHNMSNDVLQYEDDEGNLTSQNGSIANVTNPISLRAADIQREDAGAWTSSGNSTLNPDHYTVSNATEGSVAVSQTDDGAITFDADHVASGETVTATFGDVDITTDVSKRVLWLAGAAEVDGTAELRAKDGDGDYVAVTIDGSSATADANVFAGGNHSSVVTQANVNDLSVQGSGDGTLDSITELEFAATEGGVEVTLNELSVDRLSQIKYGTTSKDADGDGSTEDVDIYEPLGRYNVTSIDSLAGAFGSADIHNLRFEFAKTAGDVGDEDLKFEFDEDAAEDYNRQFIFKQWTRLSLASAQELTYLDARLTDTVVYPTSRLVEAKYIEGASSSDFSELDDSNAWVDRATEFESAGDNASVVIDDTIQEGTTYVVYQAWTADSDDRDDMTEDGGAGSLLGGNMGWLEKYIFNPISGAITILLGWLGLSGGDSDTEG